MGTAPASGSPGGEVLGSESRGTQAESATPDCSTENSRGNAAELTAGTGSRGRGGGDYGPRALWYL
jgi:hypothetical protein